MKRVALALALSAAASACTQPTISLGSDNPPDEPRETPYLPGDASVAPDDRPELADAAVAPNPKPEYASDLVAAIASPDVRIRPSGTLHATVSITNIGALDAPSVDVSVHLFPRRTALINTRVQAVHAGETQSIALAIELPSVEPGDYQLIATADSIEAIFESDETNNNSDPLPISITDITVEPQVIDFGQVAIGCTAAARTSLANEGIEPVTISSIAFGANTSDELSCVTASPLEVLPGNEAGVYVEYAPSDVGVDEATLHLQEDQTALPIDVTVRGEGVDVVAHAEHWLTEDPKIDVLLVVDNSGSMSEEQMTLAAQTAEFAQWVQKSAIDYQAAVTTTDIELTGAQGRFIGTPAIITPWTPGAAQELAARVLVGTAGSGYERGLEAAELALTPPLSENENAGFLRANAALAIIFISDEDDQSEELVDHYLTAFRNLQGGASRVVVNAIVGDAVGGCGSADGGPRYVAVSQALEGSFASICGTEWWPVLTNIGGPGFGLRSTFPLSVVPSDVSMIHVDIDGVPLRATDFHYDAALNAVIVHPIALPEPGTTLTIRYGSTC